MNDSTNITPHLHTISFYNLENFFDVKNDQYTNDNDFLPTSVKRWTPKRYENKLRKLSYAISNIGRKETGKHPSIIGVAEVENATVLKDLIAYKHLEAYNYDIVHYDSPDERGIDVGLIYDADIFTVTNSQTFAVPLQNEMGLPDYTRDILLVSGLFKNEPLHIIVNHWSSRREGTLETEPKRMAAADKVIEIINGLQQEFNNNANIVILGDFNDDPFSNSIKHVVNSCNLFNPMDTLLSYSRGTTMHKRKWNLFDQVFFSVNLLNNTPGTLEFENANIFDEDFLKQFKGRFKGTPFRTYVGKKYHGGYSDHFPVYAIFKL